MTYNETSEVLCRRSSAIGNIREADALRSLRGRFPRADEGDLGRFLRARDYDAEKAAAMYEAHLGWRAEELNWTDDERRKIQTTLSSRKFYVLDGRDAGGRPVVYFCLRRFADGSYDIEEELRAYVFMIEEEIIPSLDEGTDGTWTVLVDVSGIRMPPLSFLKRSNEIFANNYPERLNRLVMFPVPGFVKKIIRGMLHFVDPETREKFAFVNNDVRSLEESSAISSWKIMGPDVEKLVDDGLLKSGRC